MSALTIKSSAISGKRICMRFPRMVSRSEYGDGIEMARLPPHNCPGHLFGKKPRPGSNRVSQFLGTWKQDYSSIVKQLESDSPELLSFFSLPKYLWRKLRTTKVIERCFVEVRRRTRPMVCFVNVKSVDRIIYSIFERFNLESRCLAATIQICQQGADQAALRRASFPWNQSPVLFLYWRF